MDQQIRGLIDRLSDGAVTRWAGDGSDTRKVDEKATNSVMAEAAIILRAIFDPENQPSQFGTQLVAARYAAGEQQTEMKA